MGKQRSEMLQLYRQAYRTKLRLVLYFVGCPWTNNRLFLIGNQQFPERCGTLLETLPTLLLFAQKSSRISIH